MAKVAVLVPQQGMLDLALLLQKEYPQIEIMCMESIDTGRVETRSRELVAQGCELMIARGVQASIIRETVPVPLVEIRVTAQDLGGVILDLKRELNVNHPRIGMVGLRSMFCDTEPFDALFDIELHTYLADRKEDLTREVERARQDGCQAVLGGKIVCDCAGASGLPSRFIPSGAESLRAAMDAASRLSYAIALKKRNSAEMDTMLKYVFSGIMNVGLDGTILRINRAGAALLGHEPEEVEGHPVLEILPSLSQTTLEDALCHGKENYAFLVNAGNTALVANLAPIRVGTIIGGAILTFQERQRIRDMDSGHRLELHQRGYIARYTFDNAVHNSREVQELVQKAKRIAPYNVPVLITGEPGCGKMAMAQCIHNESLRRNNAFVWVDCKAWQEETLDIMLFGNVSIRRDTSPCMAELAQNGTLYMEHVEFLPQEIQFKLLGLIKGKFVHNSSTQAVASNVRVIASADTDLIARVDSGEFRSDLYYELSVLTLGLLPLRQHREDIPGWTAFYLKEWQEKYKRYIRLTQGAMRFLQEYDWPGNLDQLNSLCERIVLLAERHSVDEVFLRRQLENSPRRRT